MPIDVTQSLYQQRSGYQSPCSSVIKSIARSCHSQWQLPDTTAPQSNNKKRKTRHKGSSLRHEETADDSGRSRSSSRNASSSEIPHVGTRQPLSRNAAASSPSLPHHLTHDHPPHERALTPESFTSSQLAGYANLSLDPEASERSSESPTTGGPGKISANKPRALEALNTGDRTMRASSPAKRTRSEMESGTTRQDGDGAQKDSGSPLRTGQSASDEGTMGDTQGTKQNNPPLGEQVQQIIKLIDQPLKEGDAGYIVSQAWLTKAREQAEKGESETDPLGPVDNSSLNLDVDPTTGGIKDERGLDFVPLKPGLQIREHYEVLPSEAWNKIIQWHGLAKGSPTVVRYCHNTTDSDIDENLQFEIYPPVFTLFKLPPSPPSAAETSNPPPKKILTRRSEPITDFLKRAKAEATIPLSHNIRVWRFTGAAAEVAQAQPGVLTPANSRSTSPIPNVAVPVDLGKNMIIDIHRFMSFQDGPQRELLDVKDETNKVTATDKSSCGDVGLGLEGVLVLEEQTSGPGGGEWVTTIAASRSKDGALIKNGGLLKPGNVASGRSSPVSGIMTRGRASKTKGKGTVGLSNLGNTCYMNSALQCVRACMELTEYFQSDAYKAELNPTNPLGNKGEVAKAYANLLNDIYGRKGTSNYNPSSFRKIIGKYNPQFAGWQQQDSQEFVLFLLDGLQEDLNRIIKKPYIEKPDSTDEMVHDKKALATFAEENWSIYKKRNDSVITDLFAGMYKSTLQCPVCDKVSIIFDPFNNLTLQLPIENNWAKDVTFFPLHSRPVKLTVEVDKSSDFIDVKRFIASKIEVPESRLLLAEIYTHAFYKIFVDGDAVSEVRDGDHIACFELDVKPTNWPGPSSHKRMAFGDPDEAEDSQFSETMAVPIIFRAPSKTSLGRRTKVNFGYPGFITLNREEAKSYDKILRKVLNRVSTSTTRNLFSEDANEGEDSDTVLMTSEDAESGSSEEKIQARSVQGEDSMVDISMREPDEAEGPRIAYPPMAPLHKDLHPSLREGNLVREDLDKLFEMSLYHSSGIIPTGTTVPDDKGLPSLRKRQKNLKYADKAKDKGRKGAGGKKINLKAAIQNGGSSDDSDDELAGGQPIHAGAGSPQSTAATPEATAENSADDSDDGIPPVQEPTETLDKSYGELHVAKLVSYDTDSGPDEIDLATARRQKVVSTETSPEALVRLGEGICLDWDSDKYDAFFGGGSEDDPDGGVCTSDHVLKLPDLELDQRRTRRAQRKREGVTLDECLDEFGKPEILSENDAWYCPKCKEHRRAAKTFELWKVPDILVIHLKRFSVQGRFRDKLDVLVNFPTQGLDLTERMQGKEEDGKELVYDLFAVDNHYGGLGGGHYTAYAENYLDQQWYYFDDSSCSPRNAEDSVTKAAYLLFYRRRNSNVHLGGPNFDKVFAAHTDSSHAADESGATSRTTSPAGFSGEGRRLGVSSHNGSSSAYNEAAAVHQAGGGGQEITAEEEQEQEQEQRRQAQIMVNGVNSEDEGYGGGDDELPSYDQSQDFTSGLGQGPVYGPSSTWAGSSFTWPAAATRDDDDNSSTAAINDDDQHSLPDAHFGGTPERMDEDATMLGGDLVPNVQPVMRGVTPEHEVTEIELDDNDDVMKTE